ncbi:MAG: hypothetical protein QXZ43_03130 [Candidatus Aenigmatarchaeota archaeon]
MNYKPNEGEMSNLKNEKPMRFLENLSYMKVLEKIKEFANYPLALYSLLVYGARQRWAGFERMLKEYEKVLEAYLYLQISLYRNRIAETV